MNIQLEKEIKPGEWLVILDLDGRIAADTLRHLRQHNGGYRYRLKESCNVTNGGRTE